MTAGTNAIDGEMMAGVDSSYAWFRLCLALLISTVGGVGMWSVVVALPAIQAEFGVARADAALPYTLATIGFAVGGVVMGRVSDRFGVAIPLLIASLSLGIGYVASGFATSLWQLALFHGAFMGLLGNGATFGPVMADISQWFLRRRGLAVSIAATGNYLAGTLWPPVVQHFVDSVGWRQTHIGIGIFCAVTMAPLALAFRRRPPASPSLTAKGMSADAGPASFGLSPGALQTLLAIAGVGCCVAMAMPQVHIVAYCGDLGYGVARGAEMLSVMLGCGIISRVGSGWIADRIGGLATLLLGSMLQGLSLCLYLGFDGLSSLYVISAIFGLVQGGIVPSYAIVVREYFPHNEAGTRLGVVLMATLFGMALGGWMSGTIFDMTGSYAAAFLNGVLWNALNAAIVLWLLLRPGRRAIPA